MPRSLLDSTVVHYLHERQRVTAAAAAAAIIILREMMIRIRLTEIVENLNIKLEHKNIGKNVCMLFFVSLQVVHVAHVAIATPIHVIASGTAAHRTFLPSHPIFIVI